MTYFFEAGWSLIYILLTCAFPRDLMMTSYLACKCGYVDVKQPPRSRGIKLKAWRCRWVIINPLIDMMAGVNMAKITIYADEGTAKTGAQELMTLLIERASAIRRTKSRTHQFAFEIIDGSHYPLMFMSGGSETETQTWMDFIRAIFWPPGIGMEPAADYYQVSVIENAHAFRLHLSGNYWLGVNLTSLMLYNVTNNALAMAWKLSSIKRFYVAATEIEEDYNKMLVIQAGPASESGTGDFLLFSEKAPHILHVIMDKIREALAQRTRGPNGHVAVIKVNDPMTSRDRTVSTVSMNSLTRIRNLLKNSDQDTISLTSRLSEAPPLERTFSQVSTSTDGGSDAPSPPILVGSPNIKETTDEFQNFVVNTFQPATRRRSRRLTPDQITLNPDSSLSHWDSSTNIQHLPLHKHDDDGYAKIPNDNVQVSDDNHKTRRTSVSSSVSRKTDSQTSEDSGSPTTDNHMLVQKDSFGSDADRNHISDNSFDGAVVMTEKPPIIDGICHIPDAVQSEIIDEISSHVISTPIVIASRSRKTSSRGIGSSAPTVVLAPWPAEFRNPAGGSRDRLRHLLSREHTISEEELDDTLKRKLSRESTHIYFDIDPYNNSRDTPGSHALQRCRSAENVVLRDKENLYEDLDSLHKDVRRFLGISTNMINDLRVPPALPDRPRSAKIVRKVFGQNGNNTGKAKTKISLSTSFLSLSKNRRARSSSSSSEEENVNNLITRIKEHHSTPVSNPITTGPQLTILDVNEVYNSSKESEHYYEISGSPDSKEHVMTEQSMATAMVPRAETPPQLPQRNSNPCHIDTLNNTPPLLGDLIPNISCTHNQDTKQHISNSLILPANTSEAFESTNATNMSLDNVFGDLLPITDMTFVDSINSVGIGITPLIPLSPIIPNHSGQANEQININTLLPIPSLHSTIVPVTQYANVEITHQVSQLQSANTTDSWADFSIFNDVFSPHINKPPELEKTLSSPEAAPEQLMDLLIQWDADGDEESHFASNPVIKKNGFNVGLSINNAQVNPNDPTYLDMSGRYKLSSNEDGVYVGPSDIIQ